MKIVKIYKFILLICIIALLSGCWNYREISDLSLVAGIAIDKDYANNKFEITAEIVDFSIQGKDASTNSRLIQAEGDTIFDTVRNMIKSSPKRLYWGHSLIFIVSEPLAKEGIIEVLDWVTRDQETRSEAVILISKEPTARDILLNFKANGQPLCFDIFQSLTSQRSLSKAHKVEIYTFINDLSSEGISSTLPTISLSPFGSKGEYEISGTAIFKQDKLLGFIDGEETKQLLFVTDNIEGGLLIGEGAGSTGHPNISLEIYKSRTKVSPDSLDDELIMQIEIKTQTSIAELGTSVNYIDEKNLKKLKSDTAKALEDSIKQLIKRIQTDFDADVFGFGQIIRREMPEYWKMISSDWDKMFRDLRVEVSVDIDIKNSAFTSKPIKIGD